jgi:hypothetical protein
LASYFADRYDAQQFGARHRRPDCAQHRALAMLTGTGPRSGTEPHGDHFEVEVLAALART